MGIKGKILLPVVVLTVLISAIILFFNVSLFSDFVDTFTAAQVSTASKVAIHHLSDIEAKAASVSLSMAENQSLLQALTENNRKELLIQANEMRELAEVDFCTITDADGIVVLRTHDPEVHGDSIALQSTVHFALRGESRTAIEEGTLIRLSVCSATPIFDNSGVVAGVVSVGYRLDTELFVDSVKEISGCEATVFLGNERIATTITLADGMRAFGTTANMHISEPVLAGQTYVGQADILGRTAFSHYSPLLGADGQVIGMLFVGQYTDEANQDITIFMQKEFLVAGILLVAFFIAALIVAGRIVMPIRAMTQAATALASGDTDIDIQVHTKDEMQTLANAFNSMIDNTRQQVQVIQRIAEGDSSVCIRLRSEYDVMNQALKGLNHTIQTQATLIREEHERVRGLLDATPLACRLWNRNFQMIECNEAAVKLFKLPDKREYVEHYLRFSPEYQPDGQTSRAKLRTLISEAFGKGELVCDWMHQDADRTLIPSELTMVRIPYAEDYVVAGYSRDLREQKKMLAKIEQRDHLLQIVNQAADILLRSETGDFAKILLQCMGMMAGAIQADRMYLFKNYTENGKLYCTQLYEWSEPVQPFQDTDITTAVSYEEHAPETIKILSSGECVHCLVRDMAETDRAQYEVQGILAILLVPVFIRGELWGFVGFDNCHSAQLFSENEVFIMRSGSLLVANALLRFENLQTLRKTSSQLEAALADAKNANAAKSDFLAHMSHEIRTPLNAVVGLSELLLGGDTLADEANQKLELIHTSGLTILSIVNDILDISKIESKKFELYPARYDTPSLINDIVMLNMVRIGEKPITFQLTVDENLPASLYGDDLRVKQIFNNLLSNAFKYTHAGTVEWRIAFEKEGQSIWLVSSVQDTGIGIKPEDIQKLFANYNQVDGEANRKVEGTGLGLSIAKQLAEMMDGCITVESEYGKGTTFSVRLRQAFAAEEPIGKAVAENLMNLRYTLSKRTGNTKFVRINLSYAHVLIVDDIAVNFDVVKGMMKPYGLHADCATSGKQAIEMIRGGSPRYSAIFMDHMMPGMDGIEVTRIIREEIGTDYARNIPIIALTANAIIGNEEMFLSRGFQAFISKPIDMAKLDTVLRRWVRDKKLEKEAETIHPSAEKSDSEKHAEMLSTLYIQGVDMQKALVRFDGNEEALFNVLRSYATSTRPLLNNLSGYLAAENFDSYAIAIHGIKGASYGICAQKVGEAAEALEIAAKSGAYPFVFIAHPVFEEAALALLEELDKTLQKVDADTVKAIAKAPEPALLAELRDACKAFDMDGVDAAMARLEAFRYEHDEHLIAWLREKVDQMEFEEISNDKRLNEL